MKKNTIASVIGIAFTAASAQASKVEDASNIRWIAEQIYEKITKNSKKTEAKDMKPYEVKIPLADNASIKMEVIPGGTFKMGSAEGVVGKKAHEGPQRKVFVDPFWMASKEVTWALYMNFYDTNKSRKKNGFITEWDKSKPLEELLTQPTPQYHDMFENGLHKSERNYPAMDMTHHAASKFCEWLSAQTGHYYRLPTEAEWEFAASGGGTEIASWGVDPAKAGEYAWHKGNSNLTYSEVGKKKPNKYGLYDLFGNVAEWTLDQFNQDGIIGIAEGANNPWVVPVKRYSRVIKGGSYKSEPGDLRVGAREGSSKALKEQDPQIPKSVWYHTDGQYIGFRVVRPLKVPSVDKVYQTWNTDEWSQIKNAEDN